MTLMALTIIKRHLVLNFERLQVQTLRNSLNPADELYRDPAIEMVSHITNQHLISI